MLMAISWQMDLYAAHALTPIYQGMYQSKAVISNQII